MDSSCAAFVGPYPEGMEVRHLDGDPANNRWAPGNEQETQAAGGNLIYGTHAENMQDMLRHGTNWQAGVTRCPKNHEYTPENTRILKSGSRACLECGRDPGPRMGASARYPQGSDDDLPSMQTGL